MSEVALQDPKWIPNLRQKVERLQAEISKVPQAEGLITKHYFADGMYCRSLWRPAGCLIVGKIHKKEHFYMVASGTVRVTTDSGVREITGPDVLVCPIGTKRAVYAMTEATCITVHRCEHTDLEKVEEELVEPDESATFGLGNAPKMTEIEQ